MNKGLVVNVCRSVFCIALWVALASPLTAHEFWIEPVSYQVAAGDTVVANLRNGERFDGYGHPYVESTTNRFDLFLNGFATPVKSRVGDNPALKSTVNEPGLAIIVHEKKAATLRYVKWEKFQKFADHKGFDNIRQRHQARGLPETGFKEAYSRFSKSLVAIGGGEGSDQPVDLEVELVALNNPYTDDMANGMKVIALYRGERVPHIQIELFEKKRNGDVSITLHKTDSDGEVLLPVKAQSSYLVDMVILREPSAEVAMQLSVAWESLWASLTFAVP
jgi:uncharacterized GH25 family protein